MSDTVLFRYKQDLPQAAPQGALISYCIRFHQTIKTKIGTFRHLTMVKQIF